MFWMVHKLLIKKCIEKLVMLQGTDDRNESLSNDPPKVVVYKHAQYYNHT